MLVYMATNRINGKEYIGQTVRSLKRRKAQHIYQVLNNTDNVYFHKAIRKYSPENFDWEILHDCITNIDDLNKLEIYYIKLYNTYNNGYNLTLGGNSTLGWIPSQETKDKIGAANKGKYVGKNSLQAHAVVIGNQHFDTVSDAAKFVGITHQGLRNRILHKTKWLGYKYA